MQMPGSGWQSPGLRRGTSALPALCKGSQEIWTPRKVVAAASWCGQELSARLSRIGAFAGRAHLHVLGVVLETLDDISNGFALVADLIYSCEEGEPTGKMDKISPCCIARAPPLLLCHAGLLDAGTAKLCLSCRDTEGEFPFPHLWGRSQPSLKNNKKKKQTRGMRALTSPPCSCF